MNDLHLLIWIGQLGLSVVVPLGGFILLAIWLRSHFGWGIWVIWVGVILGVVNAILGFRDSLKAMEKMAPKQKKQDPPVISFNEHD